jgi:hypothetical protein
MLKNTISCGEFLRATNTEEYHSFPALPIFPDEKKNNIEKFLTFCTSTEGIIILTLVGTNFIFCLGFVMLLRWFQKSVSKTVTETIEMVTPTAFTAKE